MTTLKELYDALPLIVLQLKAANLDTALSRVAEMIEVNEDPEQEKELQTLLIKIQETSAMADEVTRRLRSQLHFLAFLVKDTSLKAEPAEGQ